MGGRFKPKSVTGFGRNAQFTRNFSGSLDAFSRLTMTIIDLREQSKAQFVEGYVKS